MLLSRARAVLRPALAIEPAFAARRLTHTRLALQSCRALWGNAAPAARPATLHPLIRRGATQWGGAPYAWGQNAVRCLAASSWEDSYDVLEVKRGLTDKDYKVAYLKLAKLCHPDLHPNDPDATARFQRVSAAYEDIKSSSQRAAYAAHARTRAQSTDSTSEQRAAAAAATWAEAFDDAGAMFEAAQVWWKEECAALDSDARDFAAAVETRRLGDAFELAKKRSMLVVGVALPLIIILRWPGAALAVLRGAAPLISIVIGTLARFMMRNPRLLPVISGLVSRIAGDFWRRAAARARERVAHDKARNRARGPPPPK